MLRLGNNPPPTAPPPPTRGGWQLFTESALPALSVAVVVFLMNSFQGGSQDVIAKINAIRESLPAMLAKLDDICKRETANRQNDERYRETTNEELTLLKEKMARMEQKLNLSPP